MGNKNFTDQEIDKIFRMMGYGDISKAKIWFMGIEAGGTAIPGEIVEQERVPGLDETLFYDSTDPFDLKESAGNGESPVWRRTKLIARAVFGHDQKGACFMGNMAPMPRPHENILHEHFFQPKEYITKVKKDYVPRLFLAAQKFHPTAIVFHGKGAFRTYGVAETFGLGTHTTVGTPEKNIFVYPENKVILCNNFSTRFSNYEENLIIETLKSWVCS